jgi:GGDEF domain-containing protein
MRSYDPIVRMGGDDFACGIAGARLDEVDLLFYEFERSLHADTGVGISVGMAALADGETIEQITARADAALLDAKGSHLPA